MTDAGATPAPTAEEVVRLAARAYERDRYLTALLAPQEHRDALLAVAAFAGEVARIPTIVAEPMMGEIRLQWWRDTVDAFPAGLRSGHPVADALGAAQRRYALPPGLIHGVIDAQTIGLGPEPPPDDTALSAHLAKTEGALFELAARVVLGADVVTRFAAAIRTAGRAYGLARLVAELPALTAERRTLIPDSRLAGINLTAEALYAGAPADKVRALVGSLTEEARTALSAARPDFDRAPKALRRVLLPVALVEPYLRASESPRRDPLREVVDLVPIVRVARLWWAFVSGRL